MYYIITENFYTNNSSINLDDRSEYYSDLDSPKLSIKNKLKAFELESEKYSEDFHWVGEIIASDKITKIIVNHNPFNIICLPLILDGKESYSMLSINHTLSCLDNKKSIITENSYFPGKYVIKELYIDFEKLKSYEKHLTRMFVIKEAHNYIVVNKDLGEELLEYIENNPRTSLRIIPIAENGQVPKVL